MKEFAVRASDMSAPLHEELDGNSMPATALHGRGTTLEMVRSCRFEKDVLPLKGVVVVVVTERQAGYAALRLT